MAKISKLTKSVIAVVVGIAALAGIGTAHHSATTPRVTPKTGSSNSQNKSNSRSNFSSARGKQEYVQVCYDQETGLRVDNLECLGVDEEENESSGGSYGGSGGTYVSGSSSHKSTSKSRWYWIAAKANKTTVPKVGEKVNGGYTSRPSDGIIYRNVPSQGGTFGDSFRESSSSYTVEKSQTTGTNKTNKRGGGFGQGSKTGGGTKGG